MLFEGKHEKIGFNLTDNPPMYDIFSRNPYVTEKKSIHWTLDIRPTLRVNMRPFTGWSECDQPTTN